MTNDDFDRIIEALQPGLLDWMSGLLVPLLIGGGTLAVAIWAGRIARESNRLQTEQHEDQRRTEARLRRAEYGHEVSLMSARMASARLLGGDGSKVIAEGLENMQAFARASALADEPTARRLSSWVSWTTRKRAMPQGDIGLWMEIGRDVRDMIDLWVSAPEAAMAKIEEDANFVANWKDD